MGVQELEQLDIDGLAAHTADEILDTVLPVAERRYSYDDFYARWERQHWLATEIDFTVDRQQYVQLPESLRQELVGTFAAFYQGEESVTRNLAPLLLAAPRTEHEIFLTTQTVDEARHTVFFQRVFNEVVGWDGHAEDHLAQLRGSYSPWYSNLFFGEKGLDGVADRLRQDPGDVGLFAETVTLYHLTLETGLALVGQRFLLDLCRAFDVLPGFYKGFMAVTRDESRHVGFGVRVIRELIEQDATIADRVMDAMFSYMPDVVRLIQPPDQDDNRQLAEMIPPQFFMSPQDGHRYALTHVLKRLSAAGIDAARVNELGAYAWGEFEKALGEFEDRTGRPHFAREFADDHAKGAARVA